MHGCKSKRDPPHYTIRPSILTWAPQKPYTFLPNNVWRSGLDFKRSVMRYRHMDGYISLTRDRDTGQVYADPVTGRPCIEYTPSAFDAEHTMEGVIALSKICYITGATEIQPFVGGVEPFIRPQQRPEPAVATTATTAETKPKPDPVHRRSSSSSPKAGGSASPAADEMDLGIADPAFTAWLARVRAAGNKPPGTPFASAHQMGTCRMSSHPGAGVVGPRGAVWGAEGLFVADASVFPSASGVNPMVTNMAIADWIARGVAGELAEGE